MNNPPAKSPVDDLFARRLQQHSVTPDPAGWQRLQDRIAAKQTGPVALAFWQRPVVMRYAAAACVVAVLLLGVWWFGPTNAPQIATRKPALLQQQTQHEQPSAVPQWVHLPTQMVTQNSRSLPMQKQVKASLAYQQQPSKKPLLTPPIAGAQPVAQLAQTTPPPPPSSTATTTPTPRSEQVLVVTIAEPNMLIEARQAANWSESPEKMIVLKAAPNPAKDSSRLAERSRIEAGKRMDLADNDEQSLVLKAYQVIRNKFTKKTLKQ